MRTKSMNTEYLPRSDGARDREGKKRGETERRKTEKCGPSALANDDKTIGTMDNWPHTPVETLVVESVKLQNLESHYLKLRAGQSSYCGWGDQKKCRSGDDDTKMRLRSQKSP